MSLRGAFAMLSDVETTEASKARRGLPEKDLTLGDVFGEAARGHADTRVRDARSAGRHAVRDMFRQTILHGDATSTKPVYRVKSGARGPRGMRPVAYSKIKNDPELMAAAAALAGAQIFVLGEGRNRKIFVNESAFRTAARDIAKRRLQRNAEFEREVEKMVRETRREIAHFAEEKMRELAAAVKELRDQARAEDADGEEGAEGAEGEQGEGEQSA